MIGTSRGIGFILAAMAITLLSTLSAEASLVTVNFTGTVTSSDDPDGYISGTILGDSFSGTLTYDTSATIGVPGSDPAIYTYLPSSTPAYASPLGITLTVGSHTFSENYTGVMQVTVQNNLTSAAYPDVFGAVADMKVGNTSSLAGFALGDATGTALSSTALPTSLNLSQWTVGDFNLTSPTIPGENIFSGSINLNGASVPEPGSLTLLGLGALGVGSWLCRRLGTRGRLVAGTPCVSRPLR
jgi:hypothetical protein